MEMQREKDPVPSSRIVIKNLPKIITEQRLKDICGKLGLVTDCQLKYTKNGLFRKFAFVGFRTTEEAEAAKNYLHNTFVDASRVQVEYCQRLNAADKHSNAQKKETSKKPDTNRSGEYPKVIFENLPQNVRKKSIKQLLVPLKPLRIDIQSDTNSAIVKVQKKSDVKILLKFDGRFFAGSKLSVKSCSDESSKSIFDDIPAEIVDLQAQTKLISDTGRLFVRNIPYVCSLEELRTLFEKYGQLADVKLPLDPKSGQHKGYAMISYVIPEHGLKAFAEIDGSVFNGRMLHIIPGEESKEDKAADQTASKATSSFKAKKNAQQKQTSSNAFNWNTLFLGANAVADALVDKLEAEKSQLLDPHSKSSLGVRMALGETQLVRETRDFLLQNGVCLETFESAKHPKRSASVIVVKNLPAKTPDVEIRELFSKFGELGRVVLPPSGISALVEFLNEQHARKAFTTLAYKRFKTTPLFLEWAPIGVFVKDFDKTPKMEIVDKEESGNAATNKKVNREEKSVKEEMDDVLAKATTTTESVIDDEEPENGTTIFVKNLNFTTTDDILKEHFARIGQLHYANVAKKKSSRNIADESGFLSMGYGFVQYKKRADAQKALKILQKRELEGFSLELKVSDRESRNADDNNRKKEEEDQSKNVSETKLLIRNIPFQASKREIEELFKTFGELRNVRLPRKSSSQAHRGFGFVDFMTKTDAQKAFDALKHSTHVFGRRLVLAWATEEESLDDLRKRVAEHSSGGRSASTKQQKIMLEELE